MIMNIKEFQKEIKKNEVKFFIKNKIVDNDFLKVKVKMKIGKIKINFEINDDDLINNNLDKKTKVKLKHFEIKKCNVKNFVNDDNNLLNKINKKTLRKIFKNKIEINRNN
ncbi:hypothetical protein N5T90_09120 [Aliarcobacter cryaerophilus]|uniref:hypothetical protein n=1 Tax=Aliarcobacter cryaerophilus TaxID=28198 RepID=UPI0021B3AC08|nr:hypothetical protein [Aliarcobacter cryaerophilus]MCT7471036.1 hypothetical protein [Aliarcobacter cryaerophilus]MCT7522928.1 hypothetical protein [Aliarcobacter cryaerophilus]